MGWVNIIGMVGQHVPEFTPGGFKTIFFEGIFLVGEFKFKTVSVVEYKI